MSASDEKPGEPRPPTEDTETKQSPWELWKEKYCSRCSSKDNCSYTREVACVLVEIAQQLRMRPIK